MSSFFPLINMEIPRVLATLLIFMMPLLILIKGNELKNTSKKDLSLLNRGT